MAEAAPPTIRILDAGCGRGQGRSSFPPQAYVVGIDADEQALRLNLGVDERILGDIQTYPFAPASFDEIICTDVLEHLPRPDLALANLAGALRPGGRLFVGVPNVQSFKGIATKLTPQWFHVLVYRRLFGYAEAGTPGHGPYPAYLRWSISPANLRRFAQEHGLEIESQRMFESQMIASYWRRHPLQRRILLRCWPFGDPLLSECEFSFRR